MERQILALGGGDFAADLLLSLFESRRPRVCFLPTASGDADHYVVRFYRKLGPHCDTSHVPIFRRESAPRDLRAHLLEQDLIYVGGGCLVSLLAVWRAHGLDAVLRECWEAGVVLCGASAGSLCWFEAGLTHYHHEARPVEGLGLLPGSNAVHYDDEPQRRAAYHAALLAGMPGGYAASDGAALHFVGARLERVLGGRAYRVEVAGDAVVETPLIDAPVALAA
jgi:dipeptidase E